MSGRPEEGLYGNVASQSSNVSQGGRRRTRSEFEGDTDYSSNTRRRLEGMYRPQWTMSSSVEDILLEGSTNRTDMKLNDFLRSNLGGRVAVDEEYNVTMQAFVLRPTMFINDSEILGIITKLPSYRELKMELENRERDLEERKILLEAVYKLHHEGVYSLEKWRDHEGKDTVTPLAREKLKEVLTQVLTEERREAEEKARREQQQIIFNLSAKIEDLLLKGRVRVMDIKLNDFLTLELDGRGILRANRNVLLRDFFINPTSHIRDAGVLNEIRASGAYARMERTVREEMDLEEAVRRLHDEGVVSLGQWKVFKRKNTVAPHAKGTLNAAFTEVLRKEKARREEQERLRREEEERQRRLQEMKYTISTTIEDVLFKGEFHYKEKKLNDFLLMRFGGRGVVATNRDILLEEFFKEPARYIHDAGVLNEIQKTDAYLRIEGVVREEMDKGEDVRKLKQAGVFNLQKWSEATAKVKESVHEITKSFLDAALEEARNPMTMSAAIKLEGFYESVYNASWHHVVEIPDGEGTGMEVKEGKPEQSLTYREVDESLERDDDVQQSGAARLRLMVLASDKGWPYSWAGNKLIHDCYVNFEVDRVWQIVKSDLTECFSPHPGAYFEPKRRLLIGTPGIGKSMAAGSYLLYQLLHCDAEKLPVVVYVIADEAFLFDKTTKTVTKYHTVEMSRSVISSLWQRGMKGYIIYDVAKGGRNPSVFFVPPEWGMIVVTSPNVNNFEDWRKHKGAVPIVINCPEEMDVKAMCFWMKHIQPTEEQVREQAEEHAEEQLEKQAREQAKYWKEVNERMDEVGPIPRCIFDELEYGIQLTAIDTAVENINASNATDYMGVGSDEIWIAKGVSHKIVKVVRVLNEKRVEVGYNAPVSHSARVKITQRLTNMTPPVDVFNLLLRGYSYLAWVALEQSGTATFMNPHAVDIIQRNLTELHPEGRLTSRFSVLSDNPRGHPTRSITLKKLSGNPARINLEYGVLYQPTVGNFPLVDALFFMESPRKTLVGLQTTTANAHHTQTSTVRLFKERMASYFNGWEEFARDLSWEIIYVQHADSTPMRGWQRCDDSANLTEAENREIKAFWEKKVHQYQVTITAGMLLQNRPPEVSDN